MTGMELAVNGNGEALVHEGETSVTAAAAQAKAAVEARYLVAMHRPRNIDRVRLSLLEACKRPGFAAAARYKKPIGKGSVTGPSIRFAEEAGRCLGNILVDTPTLFDDEDKRVVRVTVTDLESNLSYSGDITLNKTVERRKLRKGQSPIAQRVNSYGDTVYIVEATEDDLLTKQQANVSKHIRNGILRILPSDLLDEAMDQVVDTLRDEDAKDPKAARKKLVAAFFAQGVGPEKLVEYLGHDLEGITSAELVELRSVFEALRGGEVRWSEVMESKYGEDVDTTKGTDSLKAKLKKKAGDEDDDLALDQELAGEE